MSKNIPVGVEQNMIGWTGGDSIKLAMERITNLSEAILKVADMLLRDPDGDYNAATLNSVVEDTKTPLDKCPLYTGTYCETIRDLYDHTISLALFECKDPFNEIYTNELLLQHYLDLSSRLNQNKIKEEIQNNDYSELKP